MHHQYRPWISHNRWIISRLSALGVQGSCVSPELKRTSAGCRAFSYHVPFLLSVLDHQPSWALSFSLWLSVPHSRCFGPGSSASLLVCVSLSVCVCVCVCVFLFSCLWEWFAWALASCLSSQWWRGGSVSQIGLAIPEVAQHPPRSMFFMCLFHLCLYIYNFVILIVHTVILLLVYSVHIKSIACLFIWVYRL